MSLITVLIALAVVGYVYYSLVTTTRFRTQSFWILALVLVYFTVTNAPSDLLTNALTLETVLFSVIIGLATGVVQGRFITITRDDDGVLWQKGSWVGALVLVATLPLRFGLRYLLFGSASFAFGTGSSDLMFTYLVMFLAVVVGRALTTILRHRNVLNGALV